MVLKSILGSAGLATLFFSSSVLSGPVGPFGQVVRDYKAPKNVASSSFPAEKRDAIARSNGDDDEVENDNEASTSAMRYLNSKTSAFQVKSLPDVPFDIGEMYSGLVPISKTDSSRELFFVFQPKVGDPVDEITIWLNGGPGCSSLNGFFEENGKFVWYPGASEPIINENAWVNLTNVLWVEQPVGTGFSTGTPTASSEKDIAKDFIGFFKNFQDTFGISNYKIYVTGESYAGRYVPYISGAMLDAKNTEYYDLKGAIVYDGCIGQYDVAQEDMVVVPFLEANQQYFNFDDQTMSSLQSAHKSCGYDKYINEYLQFPPPSIQPPALSKSGCGLWNEATNAAQQANSCFNVYEVNITCPTPNDPLQPNSGSPYFDRADVKAAMHAPSSASWSECSNSNVFVGGGFFGGAGPENEGDLSPDPIQSVLPQVIEGTNRMLIANGDLDMIIITAGSLLSIQNMTWNGQLGFQSKPATPIMLEGESEQKGIQHQERGLMWTETFGSGHMGPQYQPRVAYRQLQWVLGYIDSL